MKTLRFLIAASLIGFGATNSQARDRVVTDEVLHLKTLNVNVEEETRRVTVDMEMELKPFHVASEREMSLTPMLIAADKSDSLALAPLVVAGRSRWYRYLRNGVLESEHNIYRAGSAQSITYHQEIPLEDWMNHSRLDMKCATANCCDPAEPLVGTSPSGNIPLADINLQRDSFSAPFIFAPPVDAGPVKKALEGSAFITYVVNRTELKPDYMRNRPELQKIINSIEQVRHDDEAEISGVHFKGFASPEGSYANNVRLATGRTETLRRYVRDLYHFPDSIVTSSFEPEDWQGLRSYVKDSLNYPLRHRAQIIELIDTPMDPDLRDNTLRERFPDDYTVMLRDIYPWLRHADYSVRYTIKVYTSLADIKRVYSQDPTRLRNVDFFTLAQSYPKGSEEFNNVMLKGAEIYPDDPLLNLNAANIFMEGNPDAAMLDRAQSCLLKSGNSPEATYARGVLAAKRQDYKEAARYFQIAHQEGIADAGAALSQAQRLAENAYKINYYVNLK